MKATRHSQKKKRLIDLCLTNVDNIGLLLSGVIIHSLSDHYPIFFIKKKKKLEKKICTFRGRSYLNYSFANLESLVNTFDWSTIESETNPDFQ